MHNLKDILYRNDQILEKKGNFWIEAAEWFIGLLAFPILIGFTYVIYNWEFTKQIWQNYWCSPLPIFAGFIYFFGKFLINLIRHYEFVIAKNHKLIEKRLDSQLDKDKLLFQSIS